MTSIEDVTKIVAQSEERMIQILHKEINSLREEVKTDRETSHMALAKTISNFGDVVMKSTARLEKFAETYNQRILDLEFWKEVHKSETLNICEKVENVRETLKKLMWIVITGVVVAVLGLILK